LSQKYGMTDGMVKALHQRALMPYAPRAFVARVVAAYAARLPRRRARVDRRARKMKAR